MSPALTGDPSYSVVASQSCGATLPPSGVCDIVVNYTPTVASAPAPQSAVLNMGFADVSASTPQTVSLTGTSSTLPVGQVTATKNPQVALYTMTLPFPGSMTVEFGDSTDYGLSTWSQSSGASGGQVSLFVAGMKANTTYHMTATIQFANGIAVTDVDHPFTTGAVPASANLSLTTATTPGMTPQSGLEMLNTLSGLAVTDLSGNVLWAYADPVSTSLSMDRWRQDASERRHPPGDWPGLRFSTFRPNAFRRDR